ncbi:arginase family protein [Allomesorhizobium alhagi]|jgi:arginase|uniref:Arginase family protein 2 n=1 Tax=Mesorhizobium alhagi CCNWXJ12-2 TaxID=1107882 RepID=H0HMY7_9HYPH|nr:arginase family protein [Mesorhizobium alhagi]EHK57899.1 arginase family protein 2 [Mesorhizobium alhagi CCNWXJ12-2]
MKARTILEAPSRLGLSSSGVEMLPKALLAARFAEKIGARRGGEVPPPPHDEKVDAATGVLNLAGIAAYTVTLADAIDALLARDEMPVVLGGDCSILLGCLLATRRRGRFGLLFLDGHADFFQPSAEPKGEVASMELAIAVGRHDTVLARPEDHSPLVEEEDVVAFGRRDEQDSEEFGSQRIEDSGIELINLARIRDIGIEAATSQALARLAGLEGFWLHLDADVLDAKIMPAVDYIVEGGLAWDELIHVLRQAFSTERVVGMNITILNPALDKDGSIAARFVDAVASGMKAD